MKIYKFSNILSVPFFLAALYFLFRLIDDTHDLMAAWATVPLVIIVLIYLFQPQIDYWWLSRNPVGVDKEVRDMICYTNPFYRTLADTEKEEFHKRLVLYENGREFIAKGMEKDMNVPYDIRYMISQIPVTLSFWDKNFLIEKYDRVVIYKHAFPSPLKRFLHTYEINQEDGVIIFSLEHAEASFFKPKQFFNVAWQAYAEAYLDENPRLFNLPENYTWHKLEIITGFSKAFIEKTAGFSEVSLKAATLVAYFLYPEEFKAKEGALYQNMKARFRA